MNFQIHYCNGVFFIQFKSKIKTFELRVVGDIALAKQDPVLAVSGCQGVIKLLSFFRVYVTYRDLCTNL